MKRLIALALAGILALGLLSGCGKTPEAAPVQRLETEPGGVPLPEERIPEDNWRNWYEVFVRSFSDSDGDGIGDLKGLTEKLDYIRGLGFTGLWLMPIMPSPSYHKYDVTDYYAIDPDYGTMEDFEAFLAAAHERDIRVIIDLVVNHSSDQHPWFISALADPESPYRAWYHFSDTQKSGFAPVPAGEGYYEARFVSSMPDLNLDQEAVREEIERIMAFWLDKGVDGFRLDAVTSYYTGEDRKSQEFITWLADTAHRLKPGCYIVGECWASDATIQSYYQGSSADSFFYFPLAGAEGRLCLLLRANADGNRGERYGELSMELEQAFSDGSLPAPFMGNHDLARITGSVGSGNLPKLKAINGMLAMLRGALFYYYGDEIGMVGSANDPSKRLGMLWTTEAETTLPPPEATVRYALPSVSEQEADPQSLLNYVRQAMALRNAFPAIARGSTELSEQDDPQLCLLRRTWEGESVLIVMNLSAEEKSVSVQGELLGVLPAGESIPGLSEGVLSLGPWDIAVLG